MSKEAKKDESKAKAAVEASKGSGDAAEAKSPETPGVSKATIIRRRPANAKPSHRTYELQKAKAIAARVKKKIRKDPDFRAVVLENERLRQRVEELEAALEKAK